MTQPNWEVRYKDWNGNVIAYYSGLGGETGGLTQILYNKAMNEVGDHAITLKGDLSDLSVFNDDSKKRGLDYITEIYYRPYGSADWIRDYSGFHRTAVWKSDSNGNEILTTYGFDHKHLLGRHVITALPGSSGASKSGALETVAKAFVDENIGPGAGTRAFPYFTVEADSARGTNWGDDVSGENLLEVIMAIAADGGAFDVVRTDTSGQPYFQFRWYNERTGVDRTIGTDEPAVFALDRNNMLVPVYSRNRGSEFNVVYVKGDGSQEFTEMLRVVDPDGRYNDSPWNDIEVLRKASYDELTDGLEQVGLDWMDRGKPLEKMTFAVQQDSDLLYGRDYNVGDLVTGIYKQTINKLFSGVSVNVTGDAFTFNVTLSDVDR